MSYGNKIYNLLTSSRSVPSWHLSFVSLPFFQQRFEATFFTSLNAVTVFMHILSALLHLFLFVLPRRHWLQWAV